MCPQANPPAVAPTMPLAMNTAVPRARTQSGSAICAVTLSTLKVAVQARPPANSAGAAIHGWVACDSTAVPTACMMAKSASSWSRFSLRRSAGSAITPTMAPMPIAASSSV